MVISHRLAARADGFNSAARILALRAGFLLLALYSSSGQERLPTVATESPRLSLASRVGTNCGSVFSAAGVRGYVDSRLRAAGITTSSVYTAQLAVEVDCVARGPRAGDRGIAVQQCLGYSELVSGPSSKSGLSFANTWRKCQSFVCASGRCESSMRAGMNTLMSTFFTELGKARKSSDPNARPLDGHGQPLTPPAITGKTVSQDSAGGILVNTVYYAVYILACMIVLLYWQIRSSVRSAHHG